jgi:hypothetical protein
VTLEETDRILSCGFCRVRLFLSFQGPAHYCLTTPDLPAQDLLFVPYWRYRGMVFYAEGLEIQHRVADSSFLAVDAPGLPPTLGFRPQVLKLKPPAPDTTHRFLRPQHSFDQVRRGGCGDRSAPCPEDAEGAEQRKPFEALIGETTQMIFAPVMTGNHRVWDAVLGRPLPGADSQGLDRMEHDPSPGKTIRFLPMLCPECGWDLAGEKDTLAPVCRNCHTLWDSGTERLNRLPFGVHANGSGGDIYLPFWKVRAVTRNIGIDTLGDLVRLANVPRVLPEGLDQRKLEFFVAAFKVHPQLFLRLARTFTLKQMETALMEEFPKVPLHPVTLPLAEALETLPILVGSLAVPKKNWLPRLADLRFKLIGSQVVYLPFLLKGGELIQPDTGTSLSRNALGMGRLI